MKTNAIIGVVLAAISLGAMRAKSLEGIDALLSAALGSATYPLKNPSEEKTVRTKDESLFEFSVKHSYFSAEDPFIAKVTDSPEDLALTKGVLKRLKALSLDEAVAKILAYRQLKVGEEIALGHERYVVDTVFDLNGGMPAFGFVSKEEKGTPLLLFRGTELTLFSDPGRTSILSDLDRQGVGYQTFLKAQPMLHKWLEQHPDAKVIGFSLGGTLAIYTFLYEKDLVKEAVSFCPAGVSNKVWLDWLQLSPGRKGQLTSYVSKGDWVSKKGKLAGQVYQLSTDDSLRPIAAHVTMMTFQKMYRIAAVDVSSKPL